MQTLTLDETERESLRCSMTVTERSSEALDSLSDLPLVHDVYLLREIFDHHKSSFFQELSAYCDPILRLEIYNSNYYPVMIARLTTSRSDFLCTTRSHPPKLYSPKLTNSATQLYSPMFKDFLSVNPTISAANIVE